MDNSGSCLCFCYNNLHVKLLIDLYNNIRYFTFDNTFTSSSYGLIEGFTVEGTYALGLCVWLTNLKVYLFSYKITGVLVAISTLSVVLYLIFAAIF